MKTVIPRLVMREVVRRMLRPTLHPSVPVQRQRARLEQLARFHRLPRGMRGESTSLGGSPAEVLTPVATDGRRAILYLHGGAFITGSLRTHRALAAYLAEGAGCSVYVLDYRLAPEHPYPAAVDDAEAAFLELAQDYEEVAVSGDSAGGALSVMLAMRLRDAGGPRPVAMGLISPLIDLTHSRLVLERDDMLQRTWTQAGGEAFAGGRALGDLSPSVDGLRNLPPTAIQVGTTEMLLPDSQWLADGLAAVGVPVDLRIVPRMWHVWQLHAGLFAEATDGARAMGAALGA